MLLTAATLQLVAAVQRALFGQSTAMSAFLSNASRQILPAMSTQVGQHYIRIRAYIRSTTCASLWVLQRQPCKGSAPNCVAMDKRRRVPMSFCSDRCSCSRRRRASCASRWRRAGTRCCRARCQNACRWEHGVNRIRIDCQQQSMACQRSEDFALHRTSIVRNPCIFLQTLRAALGPGVHPHLVQLLVDSDQYGKHIELSPLVSKAKTTALESPAVLLTSRKLSWIPKASRSVDDVPRFCSMQHKTLCGYQP